MRELTKPLLQFPTNSRPEAGFLFLSVNAPLAFYFRRVSDQLCSCRQRKGLTVSTAPPATRLCAVALHLPLFASLAPLLHRKRVEEPVGETLEKGSRRDPVNSPPFPRSFASTATTVLSPVIFRRIIMVAAPPAVRRRAVAVDEAVDSGRSAKRCGSSRWRRGNRSRCGLGIW